MDAKMTDHFLGHTLTGEDVRLPLNALLRHAVFTRPRCARRDSAQSGQDTVRQCQFA
jgi:hypothetical protein